MSGIGCPRLSRDMISGPPINEPVAAFAAIARALTESLDLPEVLRRIANEARALTSATGASILLWEAGEVEFAAHSTAPPGSLIPVGFRFQPSPAVVQKLRGRAEPLVINDLHTSHLIPRVVKDRIFVNDLIIVPLRADNRLIGVLNLAFNQMPDPFPWDPIILGALADQAALAVRNAQLYEASRTVSEQLLMTEKLSALGRLIAQVTHELNNPLTTARLLTESLELEELPGSAHDLTTSIGRELEHASSIVRDLLLFAHRPTTRVELDITALIRELITDLERRTGPAGITIELELPGDPTPTVYADPHAMKQVLSNLIQNAIQALTSLEVKKKIRIRVQEGGDSARDQITIEVQDSGPGLSREVRERIFEPFFTTKPFGEGTGLGLAIIREILEDHDGTIEALNAKEGGALFRISLPALPSSTSTAEVAQPSPQRGLRVLIIDDEPELQRALRRMLQHLGCTVTNALDGETGLDYIRASEFDLILCDIRLPGYNGQELYDRIRREAPEATDAIVFITGDTITKETRDFIDSTGRTALTKPFGRAQLEDLLTHVGDVQGLEERSL